MLLCEKLEIMSKTKRYVGLDIRDEIKAQRITNGNLI